MNTRRFFPLIIGLIAIAGLWPRSSQAATCSVLLRPATVTVRDAHGVFLRDIKLAWHREGRDPNNQPYLNGRAVAAGVTGLGGQWTGCVPRSGDPLALNIYSYQADKTFQILWSNDLTANDTSVTAAVTFGTLDVILRNGEGVAMRNTLFDLFREQRDVNGTLIFDATTQIATKLSTGSTGSTTLRLGQGTFVIRVASSLANRPIVRSGLVVGTGQAAVADLRLDTLRVVVVDGIGRPQNKFRFSLYTPGPSGQQVLIGRPLLTTRTNTAGTKDLLLPAGTYNVIASGTLATVFRKWNESIQPGQLTTVTFRLSGLRILTRDSVGQPLLGSRFSIFTQRLDDRGRPVADRRIVRNRTIGKDGYSDLLLPPGSYVVSVNDRQYTNIDISAEHFTRLDIPRTLTLRVSDEASFVTPLNNTGIRYRPVPPLAGLTTSTRVQTVLSGSYRLQSTSMPRSATMIFYISKKKLQENGIAASKLRIMFYAEKTKRWSFLGRYDRTRNQFVGTTRQPGTATLVVLR